MGTHGYHKSGLLMVLGLLLFFALSACGPRVVISTGTTIGLKATPGDGNTRPPQVTFGYKRAETALVPTAGRTATAKADAFSTLAAIYFSTRWFGKTEIRSFIGTGFAAREVQGYREDNGTRGLSGAQSGKEGKGSDFWNEFLGRTPRQ